LPRSIPDVDSSVIYEFAMRSKSDADPRARLPSVCLASSRIQFRHTHRSRCLPAILKRRLLLVICTELVAEMPSRRRAPRLYVTVDHWEWLLTVRAGGWRTANKISGADHHIAPPSEKQKTVSGGYDVTVGGGAHRWFLPSGLSRLRSTFRGGMGSHRPSSRRRAYIPPSTIRTSVG
jgi:hypothetical protein